MAANTAENIEEFDELEAMLADMQDEVAPEEVVIENDATQDIDLDELSDDLEEAERAEPAIQLQAPKKSKKKASKKDVEDVVDAEVVEEDEAKAEKKPKAKKASAPRFTSSSSLVSYGEQLFNDDKPLLLIADDADKEPSEATEDNLTALNLVKPVKVREKLANALAWLSSGKTLSKYTMATFQLIKDKESVTKADVTNHLLDQGVSLGTASSQSGQMTHLLTELRVAQFKGGKFVANPDSIVLAMIESAQPQPVSEDA